jgi:large subunit ribosomal protein L7/L12
LPEVRVPGAGNERVQKVVKDILALNLLEVSDLIEILSKELGVAIPAAGNFMAAAPAPAAAGAAAEAAPPAEEKTEFDVKLDGFEAASKIKVIKEIRGVLPELGLKEAKELVEKSPTVIKTGMKKEEAEALKKKLEAVGGKISLE